MRLFAKNHTLKLGDILLILIIVVGISVFSIHLYAKDREGKEVVIKGQGFEKVYSLNSNQKIKVKGPLGYTVVKIVDGKAWIENSPCREKICMKMGKISRVGQQVICVPNKVLVEVKGQNGVVDAVSR